MRDARRREPRLTRPFLPPPFYYSPHLFSSTLFEKIFIEIYMFLFEFVGSIIRRGEGREREERGNRRLYDGRLWAAEFDESGDQELFPWRRLKVNWTGLLYNAGSWTKIITSGSRSRLKGSAVSIY